MDIVVMNNKIRFITRRRGKQTRKTGHGPGASLIRNYAGLPDTKQPLSRTSARPAIEIIFGGNK